MRDREDSPDFRFGGSGVADMPGFG